MRGWKVALALLLAAGLLCAGGNALASESKRLIEIGTDVTVEEGTKVRSVLALAGQVTISGTVEKDVVAFGGSVVLTKTAVVGGNVSAVGGVIVIARDAEVGGSLTEINSSNLYDTLTAALSNEWEGWSWVFAVISLAIFLVLLVLGMLIAALLPKPVLTVSEAIAQNTFKVTLWGILGLVTVAPLALLLAVSVVGIALIPLEIVVVACSVLLGFIAVGRGVGHVFLKRLKRPHPSLVRETFWGLLILWGIGWLPYIGWMAKAVAIVLGLGAVLVTRFGTFRGWECPPCAPVAPPPVPEPEPAAPVPLIPGVATLETPPRDGTTPPPGGSTPGAVAPGDPPDAAASPSAPPTAPETPVQEKGSADPPA